MSDDGWAHWPTLPTLAEIIAAEWPTGEYVIREHVPDADGCCAWCSNTRFRVTWPCPLREAAEEAMRLLSGNGSRPDYRDG